MALPMLPGYSFADPTKRDFRRTQAFGFKNGMVVHSEKSTLDQLDPNETISMPPITLLGPMGDTRKAQNEVKLDQYTPSDMKYYKKVLRFDAYWKEIVGNERRDRGACIHYFLEDDTIQIIEPRQQNSGIPQGTLLNRQAIPYDGSLAASAPFQTILNAPPPRDDLAASARAMRTAAAPVDTIPRTAKGGQRDPNNYLASLSLNDPPQSRGGTAPGSPLGSRTNSANSMRSSPPASPGLSRTASPNSTGRNSPSNGFRTSPKSKSRSRAGPTWHWGDLSVGADVNFFGRTYRIADADAFTREFFRDQGVDLLPAEPLPESLTYVAPPPNTRLLSHESKTTEERFQLRKFLENDRKVLRFYCMWDDTASVYGDKRPFILHYFLVDDTVELREILALNSGRDPSTIFMKKQRLPKKPTSLSDLTSKQTEFYTDADLKIGDTINVFGRNFLLYDADPFTRTYYEDMYGITNFPVLQGDQQVRESVSREIPEYNGFGSEEDSLANCLSLVPKPPKKIVRSSAHTPNEVLRFTAHMEQGKKGDEERRFVISFFLEDDTVSVFENPVRGIRGGKFLERRKLKNPRTNEVYNVLDFFVGALIDVNSHKLRLVEADSFATQYIQQHEEEYADVAARRTLEDVKQAVSQLRAGMLKRHVPVGELAPAAFRQALSKAGLNLDDASFTTICTLFSNGGNYVDTGAFIGNMEQK